MSLRRKILDGKRLFRHYWLELGEARSLTLLVKESPINPRTGERFTKDAFYKAMWRWACRPENERESYDIFRRTTMGNQPEWTLFRWRDELKEKARWVLTPAQYRKWYKEKPQ